MPEPSGAPQVPKPQELLELAASFLNRLSTDQDFATKFDKDPAETLKAFHPALAKVPKKQLDDAVEGYITERDSALRAAGMRPGESLWVPPLTGAITRAGQQVVKSAGEFIKSIVDFLVTLVTSSDAAVHIPE